MLFVVLVYFFTNTPREESVRVCVCACVLEVGTWIYERVRVRACACACVCNLLIIVLGVGPAMLIEDSRGSTACTLQVLLTSLLNNTSDTRRACCG